MRSEAPTEVLPPERSLSLWRVGLFLAGCFLSVVWIDALATVLAAALFVVVVILLVKATRWVFVTTFYPKGG